MLRPFNAFGIWAIIFMIAAGIAGQNAMYVLMVMLTLCALGLAVSSLIFCIARVQEAHEIIDDFADAAFDSDFGYHEAHQ